MIGSLLIEIKVPSKIQQKKAHNDILLFTLASSLFNFTTISNERDAQKGKTKKNNTICTKQKKQHKIH